MNPPEDGSAWQYQPSPDLAKTVAERLHDFPRQPDMLVYGIRSGFALFLRLWLRLYHRLRVEGVKHFPKNESFILVCNHTSHLDALSLLSIVPMRQLHRAFPAAAADYFFTNLPRTLFSAIFINALPFGRLSHMRESLEMCRELLKKPGAILILFPEGTRSTDGQLQEFKPGIGLLVAGSSIPVVPCYLHGGFQAWPRDSAWPRPRLLRLNIGPALRFADLPPEKSSAFEVSRRLREAVIQLKNQ